MLLQTEKQNQFYMHIKLPFRKLVCLFFKSKQTNKQTNKQANKQTKTTTTKTPEQERSTNSTKFYRENCAQTVLVESGEWFCTA